MRSKALKLAAALALATAASLAAPPAQALITCSCIYCLPNQGATCTATNGLTMSCLSYVRNFCLN
jgi:hypothetical protein